MAISTLWFRIIILLFPRIRRGQLAAPEARGVAHVLPQLFQWQHAGTTRAEACTVESACTVPVPGGATISKSTYGRAC